MHTTSKQSKAKSCAVYYIPYHKAKSILFSAMASYNCFILAFFIAISFSSMEFGLAARHLMQTNPSLPTLPKPTALPPLPSIIPTLPTLPQPQGNVPPLPTIPSLPKPTLPPLPTIPTVPQVTLPPFPSITSLPNMPSFPSIPFFSPPPSSTSP